VGDAPTSGLKSKRGATEPFSLERGKKGSTKAQKLGWVGPAVQKMRHGKAHQTPWYWPDGKFKGLQKKTYAVRHRNTKHRGGGMSGLERMPFARKPTECIGAPKNASKDWKVWAKMWGQKFQKKLGPIFRQNPCPVLVWDLAVSWRKKPGGKDPLV